MPQPPTPDPDRRPKRLRAFLWLLAIVVLAVVALRLEGHRWWCRCGRLTPWSGDIFSSHNSQHLLDPYTFTHMEHGVLIYAALWLCARRLRPASRFMIAVGVEALWEVLENSPAVIERYRQATISLGYAGDTVINSLGDIAACALGFYLAQRLPVRWSVGLLIAVEAGLLAVYRDNLTLNVLMLVYPFEAVKSWQTRG
jgi:hypothetical protein